MCQWFLFQMFRFYHFHWHMSGPPPFFILLQCSAVVLILLLWRTSFLRQIIKFHHFLEAIFTSFFFFFLPVLINSTQHYPNSASPSTTFPTWQSGSTHSHRESTSPHTWRSDLPSKQTHAEKSQRFTVKAYFPLVQIKKQADDWQPFKFTNC